MDHSYTYMIEILEEILSDGSSVFSVVITVRTGGEVSRTKLHCRNRPQACILLEALNLYAVDADVSTHEEL